MDDDRDRLRRVWDTGDDAHSTEVAVAAAAGQPFQRGGKERIARLRLDDRLVRLMLGALIRSHTDCDCRAVPVLYRISQLQADDNELLARLQFPRSDVRRRDRKSTRLNSSHGSISYAVFCLK